MLARQLIRATQIAGMRTHRGSPGALKRGLQPAGSGLENRGIKTMHLLSVVNLFLKNGFWDS